METSNDGTPSSCNPVRVLRFQIPKNHTPTWLDIVVNDRDRNEDEEQEQHIERNVKDETIAKVRELYRKTNDVTSLRIGPNTRLENVRLYSVKYPGPSYNLIMISCYGRCVVKYYQNEAAILTTQNNEVFPKIGSIIVAVNGYMIPYGEPFSTVVPLMKSLIDNNPPVTVIFAEDKEFISYFTEEVVPNIKEEDSNWFTNPEETDRAKAKTTTQSICEQQKQKPTIDMKVSADDNLLSRSKRRRLKDGKSSRDELSVDNDGHTKNISVNKNGLFDQLPDLVKKSVVSYLPKVSRAVLAASLRGRLSFLFNDTWDTIDFNDMEKNAASRFTDEDIHSILTVTDSVNCLMRINLANLTQITGSGLCVLNGSSVLEHIDLSLVPENHRASDIEENRLKEDVICSLLDSIMSIEGSSLAYINLPKTWLTQPSQIINEFIRRYKQYMREKSFQCLKCNRICQNDIGYFTLAGSDTVDGVLSDTCHTCSARIGRCCAPTIVSDELFHVCEVCEKGFCSSCKPMTECCICEENVCTKCCTGVCRRCDTVFCSATCENELNSWTNYTCSCCKKISCSECPDGGFHECVDCNKKNCFDCNDVEGNVQLCGLCGISSCLDCKLKRVKEAELGGSDGESCVQCKGMVFSKMFKKYITADTKG